MRPKRACVADAEQRIKAIVAWENCTENSELFKQAAAAIDAEFAGESARLRGVTEPGDAAEMFDDERDAYATDEDSVASQDADDSYESSFIDDSDVSECGSVDSQMDWGDGEHALSDGDSEESSSEDGDGESDGEDDGSSDIVSPPRDFDSLRDDECCVAIVQSPTQSDIDAPPCLTRDESVWTGESKDDLGNESLEHIDPADFFAPHELFSAQELSHVNAASMVSVADISDIPDGPGSPGSVFATTLSSDADAQPTKRAKLA